jgi:hypothetical protein
MSEDHFRIIYDGPAVEDGQMEIGQLAPSLLALGKLVEALDLIESGEPGRVRVMVRSDIRPGSFDIGLSLDFLHSVKEWLISPTGQAVIGAMGLLGLTGKDGLIQAVRWLRGRPVKTKIVLKDGNVQIETADLEILVVPAPVSRALEDQNVRLQLEKFTEPLREDGVEDIRFETGKPREGERILASEAEHFVASVSSEPTSQATFQATYQIKRLYFERKKKWRLSNGAQTILAEIVDEDFWKRVEAADVSFSADDYLVCAVRMDQWMNASGLKTEYVVEKVLKHIPAPKQQSIPGT